MKTFLRRLALWPLVALLILSCLSPQSETDSAVFYHEGSRLKANYTDYGGGATQFNGWFDTTLGENCRFSRFSSGEIACIPNSAPQLGQYFEDGTCTRPLAPVANSPCPTTKMPSYAYQQSSNLTCDNENSFTPGTAIEAIYSIGKPFKSKSVFTKTTTGCVTTTAPADVDLFSRGALASLSTFVKAQVKLLPRGVKNSLAVYAGEDGSQEFLRPRFGAQPCSLRSVDNDMICIPNFNAFTYDGLFVDQTCMTPIGAKIAFENNNLCFPTPFVQNISFDAQQCKNNIALFTKGSEQTPPPLFNGTPASCTPFSTSNLKTFSVGAPVDLRTTFGVAQRYSQGTGRIQARFYGTGPTEALSPVRDFFDTQSMKTCWAVRFNDGVTRCIDADVISTGFYFGDDKCTAVPLIVTSPSNCPGSDMVPTRALLQPPPATCSATDAVGAVGLFSLKPHTDSIFQRQNTTTCTPFTQPVKAFKLDQPLDISGFAIVKTVQR